MSLLHYNIFVVCKSYSLLHILTHSHTCLHAYKQMHIPGTTLQFRFSALLHFFLGLLRLHLLVITQSTPGHTSGCMSWVLSEVAPAVLDAVVDEAKQACDPVVVNPPLACFTGDTMLVRSCGRTDFQVPWLSRLDLWLSKELFRA